jgi:hypothetical protein
MDKRILILCIIVIFLSALSAYFYLIVQDYSKKDKSCEINIDIQGQGYDRLFGEYSECRKISKPNNSVIVFAPPVYGMVYSGSQLTVKGIIRIFNGNDTTQRVYLRIYLENATDHEGNLIHPNIDVVSDLSGRPIQSKTYSEPWFDLDGDLQNGLYNFVAVVCSTDENCTIGSETAYDYERFKIALVSISQYL